MLRFICIRLVMLVYLFSTNLVMAFRSPNIFRSPYFTSFITSLSNGVPDVKAQSILRLEVNSNDSYTKFWQLSFDWGNLSIQLHWKHSVPCSQTILTGFGLVKCTLHIRAMAWREFWNVRFWFGYDMFCSCSFVVSYKRYRVIIW